MFDSKPGRNQMTPPDFNPCDFRPENLRTSVAENLRTSVAKERAPPGQTVRTRVLPGTRRELACVLMVHVDGAC